MYTIRTNSTTSAFTGRGGFFYATILLTLRMERVTIYIDGSNTYKRLKGLGMLQESTRFNYSAFVEHLIGDRILVSKRMFSF